ncbi:uncharacterized protein Dana_GF26445 [Drosophila ananassae]|uniref:Uncharacterized protein n=1 Tax=Drosophila ananassae TaxID=7217 RepID=A0A0P8XN83_DROAN|nr:uncharacterized protein LOC26513854 [Drosophila ananassae]KPU76109.1 uncharacterized protein Dana_GF26445 [Drosophila ananassae]
MSVKDEFIIKAYSNFLEAKREAKAKIMEIREIKHQLEGISIAVDKAKDALNQAKKNQHFEKKFLHCLLNKPILKRRLDNSLRPAFRNGIHPIVQANVNHLMASYLEEIERTSPSSDDDSGIFEEE